MRIYGSRVRDAGVIVFDIALLTAFPFHFVESALFWGGLAGLMGLSALTVVVLELTRLVAPGFSDNWWGPE